MEQEYKSMHICHIYCIQNMFDHPNYNYRLLHSKSKLKELKLDFNSHCIRIRMIEQPSKQDQLAQDGHSFSIEYFEMVCI